MFKNISKKRSTILLVSLISLAVITVGVTLAYVFSSTNNVMNQFIPSKVACAVVENGNDPVTSGEVENVSTKSDVRIQNTGDTEAYIRVAVVVNWKNDAGTVWATKPVLDTDYEIDYNLPNGWFYGGDGFYYYSKPVSPETLTNILINSARLKEGVVPPTGTDGSQYFLSIEIVASAIQSKPASTVTNQWGVTVDDQGNISK